MRELLTILGAILAVSLLGWGGYVLLFGSGKDAGLIIRETAGTVDYIDANGATFPASIGQTVEAKARLRSGEDGRVDIRPSDRAALARGGLTAAGVGVAYKR